MVKFSIIIPVKAINDYVRETVPYIQALDSNEWELIILPNEKDLDEWSDARIKIIPSGRVGPAAKRDIGATYAVGDILVFLDDDSYPSPNLLSIALPYFVSADVVAIGGPAITPPNDSFWQKVSGAVFLSRHSGGIPERYAQIGDVKNVQDWPSVNLIVRKNKFLEVGGFNSLYWPGEDTKLCLDLISDQVSKILYVPGLIVWHHRREGLINHLRQIGAYGLHRGFFVKKYPKTSLKILYFLPMLFFIYTIFTLYFLIIPSDYVNILMMGWVIYFMNLIFAAKDIVKYESALVAIAALPYIVATHFWYGYKFSCGLLAKNLKSRLR
jgi:glycosyltransferase involved in cell wall biosynthesis